MKPQTNKSIALNKKRASAQMKIYLGIEKANGRRNAILDLAEQVIPDDALDTTRGVVSKQAKLFQRIADIFMAHPDGVASHVREILKLGNTSVSVPGEAADAKFARLVREGVSRNDAAKIAYGRNYAGNIVARGKRALGED